MSYDAKDHLFSCSLDRNDQTTATYFLSQLKFFTSKPPGDDATEPAFVPLDGSTVRTTTDTHNPSHDPLGLLDLALEDSSSEDEVDPLQGIQHLTAYWKPGHGDIRILSTATAQGIASLTGCSIYPEPREKRVRLVNGNFRAALKKLRNLEPLMVANLNLSVHKVGSDRCRNSSINNELSTRSKPTATC